MISIYLYLPIFLLLFLTFLPRNLGTLETIKVKNKNPLNGLRAILASIVMYSHTYKELYVHSGNDWLYTQSQYFQYFGFGNQAINGGKIGVAIFFMISGYLFYSLLNKSNFDSFKFLKQRFKRIFPLYFFIITFCFLYNYKFFNSLSLLDKTIEYFKFLIFFGDNTNITKMTSGVEWSLKLEILMYFTIPVLFYLFHNVKNKISKHILIFASVIAVFLISYITRMYFEFYIDPRAALCFYVGYVALDIKNENILTFIKSKTFSVISLLFLTSAFFVTAFNFYYLYLIFACSFIFLAAVNGNDIFGFLINEQIQKLGEISYSIYLTHGVLLFFLMKVADTFISFGTRGSVSFIFIHFLLTFLVSVLSYKYIEQGFNRPHFRSLLISKFKQF
ncbi:acyltransferase [Acinetobacter nosocomialis]|uniref:acyltransferase family protein n=1 Tax=Acinetobacter nosocomialis TaxID=106654 RepID=UPI00069891F9|nr:acyltransferase [Acinetobacter nosocomialis]MBM9558388.1 acyltransferase [Acinetobacter nosocomialis]